MANKNVFASASKGKTPPIADTVNRAGGKAYKMDPKAALAQYAAVGTFNDGFYVKGEALLDEVLEICKQVDPEFIAKTALYARDQGRMKDMPALLAAHLTTRGPEGLEVLKRIFLSVINNGRMLRNFIQIIRSGKTGRKSLGTAPKKLVQSWFDTRSSDDIFRMSIGNDPSMADIIKLAHPIAKNEERKALHGYLIGEKPLKVKTVLRTDVVHGKKSSREREIIGYDPSFLPAIVKEYEAFKKAKIDNVNSDVALPRIPWEMVTGLPLSDKDWAALARQATWTQIRMNLNTFARHGVYKDEILVKEIAEKIKDRDLILRARTFPYQLLMTYIATLSDTEFAVKLSGMDPFYGTTGNVPASIQDALHDALDVATENVPTVGGVAYIGVDVSGSMQSPITGDRKGASTKMRMVDVAALVAATLLRKNKGSEVLPFSDDLFLKHGIEPRDSIMTNARKLASLGGGGTNMTSVLAYLNKEKKKGDLVIMVSDCETWTEIPDIFWGVQGGTGMASAWAEYKSRNPGAKLVTINLAASDTTQVVPDKDVLQLGGFSDTIWEVIKSFVEGMPSADHWVKTIEAVQLPEKI